MSDPTYIRMPNDHGFSKYNLRPLLPCDARALADVLTDAPVYGSVLAKILREHLHDLQRPPGSGFYDAITIVKDVQILARDMEMIGLWAIHPIEQFLNEMVPAPSDEFKKWFLGNGDAKSLEILQKG